jgi:hypothetical protein
VSNANDDITPEEMEIWEKRSREDASAEGVKEGLQDAEATLAEIWRNTADNTTRHRCLRALRAVISARMTMEKAEAFLLAPTGSARLEAFDKLRIQCVLRIGHDVRRKP